MKRKITLVAAVLVLCSMVIGVAYATTVNEELHDQRNKVYNIVENGSVSQFTARSLWKDESAHTANAYSTLRNTSASTIRASVVTREYNSYAHTDTETKSNENNSLASNSIIATGYVSRSTNAQILEYYHEGKARNYQNGNILDSYKYRIVQ